MLRFAPSPTGDMHIGNLRVALFNYIVSRQRDEDLIIRIEDTDKERNIEGKDAEIVALLDLFGIKYKEVIYQSKNLKFHQALAVDLLHKKKAFNCFCTNEELERKREEAKKAKKAYRYDGTCLKLPPEEVIDNPKPFSVRIKKPDSPVKFTDIIKGEFEFAPDDIDSFIILRVDKTPTYNFACAVDDMLNDISLVIRGEDHLSNTPKQIHIRKELGYEKDIEYAHLPIILNQEGKKMSKRDNASSVKWLLEEGFLPSAIANYLILLGNKTPKEIFTLDEAVEFFELKNISKSPAKFDIDMLRHINREHLKNMDEKELSRYVGFADGDIGALAKIYLEEASTTKELKEKISKIFGKKDIPDEYKENAEIIKKAIQEAEFFEEFDDLKKYITDKTGLKGKNLFKPLRIILTGSEHGPDLSDIYKYLKNYIQEVVK